MTIAWYDPTNHHVSTDKHDPLFTPLGQLWPLVAKQEWVGLTDEEVKTLRYKIDVTAHWTYDKFYEAIEAKLKEKNGG